EPVLLVAVALETSVGCDPDGDEITLQEICGTSVVKPLQALSGSVAVALMVSWVLALTEAVGGRLMTGRLAPQFVEVTGKKAGFETLPSWSVTVNETCQVPLGTSAMKEGEAAVVDESCAEL